MANRIPASSAYRRCPYCKRKVRKDRMRYANHLNERCSKFPTAAALILDKLLQGREAIKKRQIEEIEYLYGVPDDKTLYEN